MSGYGKFYWSERTLASRRRSYPAFAESVKRMSSSSAVD